MAWSRPLILQVSTESFSQEETQTLVVPSDLAQIRGSEQDSQCPAAPVCTVNHDPHPPTRSFTSKPGGRGAFWGVEAKIQLHPIREAPQISCPKKDHRETSRSLGLSFLICNVGKIPLALATSRTVIRGKRDVVCERWSDTSLSQWGKNSTFV